MEQLRPPSSVSLLADQLQKSSLNETVPEEKTRLISVDQTAIHRRRLSTHDRRLGESAAVASLPTSSLYPACKSVNSDGPLSTCFCKPGRFQLECEKENSNAKRISKLNASGDCEKLYSISAPTPVFFCKTPGFPASCSPTSTPSVTVLHPSSAPFKRFPSTALNYVHCTSHCACCLATGHHIPAKRVCRPFSVASSVNHLNLCTMHSNCNDFHLLESHLSTLPRPVAVRMTPTDTSSIEHTSSNRPFQFSASAMSTRRCPLDFHRTSRLGCHHPPFSKELGSYERPINGTSFAPTYDVTGCTVSSVKSSSSVSGSDTTESFRIPSGVTGAFEGVQQAGTSLPICLTCGSESDASNSSGVESLLRHYSAFTPTRVLRNSPRDDPLPHFSSSVSPGVHSVSSSVPLSAPTPSSGFHEMSSYFPNVSSLPDCTKEDFRFRAHVCVDERHALLLPYRVTTTERSESPIPCSRSSHCDALLRCWSNPTSIANNPVPVNSPLETLSGAVPDSQNSPRDPTGTLTAGFKRRWRKSIESESSIVGLHPSTCSCQVHECPAHGSEIEPTCDLPRSSDWNHSPALPSGEASGCEVFVFGPYLSNWGNGLFHDDGPCTHSDSRCCMRTEQWKSQTNRDVYTSCKSFTFDPDRISCRHLLPQLTDLSELVEEEKDNETPEFVLEKTGGDLSNLDRGQSRYPTIASPSVFQVTFEPINASCENEGQVDQVTTSDLTAPSERISQLVNPPNRPVNHHNISDILIPLSSTDSDELSDEVVLSPRLVGRHRRNGDDTLNTCGAPPAGHLDIDLELMENN